MFCKLVLFVPVSLCSGVGQHGGVARQERLRPNAHFNRHIHAHREIRREAHTHTQTDTQIRFGNFLLHFMLSLLLLQGANELQSCCI